MSTNCSALRANTKNAITKQLARGKLGDASRDRDGEQEAVAYISIMKVRSTSRLQRKSGSVHRSEGMCMKPTSTGVMQAVKTSASETPRSQYPVQLLERGSTIQARLAPKASHLDFPFDD